MTDIPPPSQPSPTEPGSPSSPDAPPRPPGPVTVSRAGDMAWSGIQTFAKVPLCLTPADLRAGGADVAIGGAPWEGTASGRTGTHLGPRAIRECDYLSRGSWTHLDVRVDPFEHLVVCDYGDAEVLIGNTDGTYASIRAFVAEMLDGGAVPVVLGGDHGITWPAATAVADAYGHGTVGVVHFDAHADTAPDMRGTLAGHGTPMRRLIESGAVPGRNFVQVGLRGYWPDPPILAWMEEQKMRTHFMAEIRADGFDAVLDRALSEALDTADHLYISVDVDCADPAFAPGTGTPEPGGLTSGELLRAVRRLAAEVGAVGMDVVEVSPPYDAGNNITALFANRCVMEALTGTAMRRLGITQPDFADPRSLGHNGVHSQPARP
jgi:agmatinase